MADKEATVYIIDVGRSMGEIRNGREQSDFDWAMTYVWEKITSTVALDRKTATLGVLGFKTDDTRNELQDDSSFHNIYVMHEISQKLVPDLKELQYMIKVSEEHEGDAISAIIIAIQMIATYCKKLKYWRKIVLVTNGLGGIDADCLPEIIAKIKQDDIELVIIGADFDDPEYGFKEEVKDPQKARNESILKELVDGCHGVFGTLKEAIEELGVPRLKNTRPVISYKGQLTLGDPQKFDSALCIDVERYPRTMIRRPLTASRFVQRTNLSNGDASAQSSATILPGEDGLGFALPKLELNELANVKSTRMYQVADGNSAGGKRDVDRDNLAKGYEYGRTAVHISESDQNVTKLEILAGLEIVGFIPWDTYQRYMNMSVSNVIIAQKTNTKAIIALSSLIHALFELESYAVARLVAKAGKDPVLLLLAPSIEVDYECLLDVQLPFAEDVRSYKFPPLDKVITVSGKVIKEHRNLPNDALSSAMSDYVDQMDLSAYGKDDEGNAAEYMPMAETYSPVLHRLDQAVRWRAVHPNEPIPPPYEILTRYSKPPDELIARSEHQLETLIKAADVKKVPPKAQSRRQNRHEVKPQSGLDVHAILGGKKSKARISPENPIPEFRQTLDQAEELDTVRDAVKQFCAIIEQRVKDSFSDLAYGRAIEELGVLRHEMIELEEPGIYNDSIQALKRKLLSDELGGDRREMWDLVRKNHLGLIEKKTSEQSSVTEAEAKAFLQKKYP